VQNFVTITRPIVTKIPRRAGVRPIQPVATYLG
jgi:hypothetical protein